MTLAPLVLHRTEAVVLMTIQLFITTSATMSIIAQALFLAAALLSERVVLVVCRGYIHFLLILSFNASASSHLTRFYSSAVILHAGPEIFLLELISLIRSDSNAYAGVNGTSECTPTSTPNCFPHHWISNHWTVNC